MTKILAEAGRITELGPEMNGEIIFGLQPNYAKYAPPPADEVYRAGQSAERTGR